MRSSQGSEAASTTRGDRRRLDYEVETRISRLRFETLVFSHQEIYSCSTCCSLLRTKIELCRG
eukprot:760501-Hanusia_phi.AAC.1